jgi:hypothetical protein
LNSRSSCLSLPSAGITAIHHHAQLSNRHSSISPH